MRMGIFGLAYVCAATTALHAVPTIPPASIEAPASPGRTARRGMAQAGMIPLRKRNKAAQAKPRKRVNRMHISRRTRRKHRRAA